MRFINEKGKLFGLVNPIDLLVVLLIVLIAGGAVYKLKFSASGSAAKTVYTTVRIPMVIPDVVDKVKVGDKIVSGSSYTDVQIVNVKVLPAKVVTSTAVGDRKLAIDPWNKDMYVTVKGKTGIPEAEVNMGGQEIRVGKDYFVKTFTTELKGTIVEVKIQ